MQILQINFKAESTLERDSKFKLSLWKRCEIPPIVSFETVYLTSSSHLRLGVRTLEPHSKDIGSNPIDGAFFD